MVFQPNPGMKQVLMRAGVAVMAVFMIGMTLTGCGNSPAASTTTTKTTTAVSNSTTKTAASSTTAAKTSSTTKTTTTTKTSATTTSKTVSNDPFIRLDDKLEELVVYFQKTWMAAEAVGAKEGYKYATYSGTFELYLYDHGTDAYKAAVQNNAMSLGDTLFPAIIKEGFALYFYPNAKEELRTQIQGILFP